jgi:DNA-binding GntR family transcriptional regulator
VARIIRAGADAYEAILAEIEHGRIAPGSRLMEADLAERLSISRTPVREALKRLEAQGLATHEPGRGMVVSLLDHDQLRELYDMREVLEGAAARHAAANASPTEIALIGESAVKEAKLRGTPADHAAANRHFHRLIYRASRNRFLARHLGQMQVSLTLLPHTTLAEPGRRKQAATEHRGIAAAIAERDLDRAETLAREHIRHAYAARLRQLAADDECRRGAGSR